VAIHSQKILSLFSGIGGLDLGIKLALKRSRTVCYVEREAYPCSVLVSRFKDGSLDDAPIWSDIKTFSGKIWRKKIDIIIAGFPCQPWSIAGKRKKTNDDRWLWPDIEKIIRQVGPFQIFLENVPEICNGGIHLVLGSLASLGFDAEWGVFSAEQIGTPHRRRRVFILAQLANPIINGAGRRSRNTVQKIRNGKPPFKIRNSREDLANPTLRRLWKQKPLKELERDRSRFDRERLLLFPPGPGDLAGWKRYIERSDPIKPAVCRGSNGTSSKVGDDTEILRKEEIRALGNGVVPHTAAFAYSVLSDRLNMV